MKRLTVYITLFFVIASLNNSNAQTTVTPRQWTIEDCFKYAAGHNIQITSLRLDQQSVMQDLIAARANKIPSLFGSMSNNFNNANGSENGGFIDQLTTSGSYSLNSSIVLWNDNSINHTIRQRELLTQSASLSVQQSFNDITLLITEDYLNILLAKENLTYITDLVNTSDARVKQGEMFYDAGSIAKKDLLQLQAQLASDKYLLVQTQNAIRQNILSLKQSLQLPVDSLFDIITPDTVIVATSLISLYEVRRIALRDFPEIKIGQLGLDIANLDIAKAKAGFKPTLSANGTLGSGYSGIIINSTNPKTGYFTQVGNNFYQRVGLTLSIPIFSNRINQTNLEKANIYYKTAKLSLQNNELILSQAVEQAYLNANNAIQSYTAADEQLKAATESYRISNEQFKLEAINIYDLLQQRNQYIQAVQAFTQSKYTAVLQQKIYEFYMGKPITL